MQYTDPRLAAVRMGVPDRHSLERSVMSKLILCFVGCFACTFALSPTPAQAAPGPFSQHTAAEIAEDVRTLTEQANRSPTGISTETWERFGDHDAMLAVRVRSGGGEVHLHSGDYFFVLQGHATEVVGGSLEDGKEIQPGELRGKSVRNGTPHYMGSGDFIHISADTPHQTIITDGAFAYLVVKAAE